MKSSERSLWGISGAGAIVGCIGSWILFHGDRAPSTPYSANPPNTYAQIVTNVSEKTAAITIPSLSQKSVVTPSKPAAVEDPLITRINANPTVKRYIQGTVWFQKFLNGTVTADSFREYLDMVEFIEKSMEKSPELRTYLEQQPEGITYFSGGYADALPTPVYSTIHAIQLLRDFQRIDPNQYNLLTDKAFTQCESGDPVCTVLYIQREQAREDIV